MPERAITYIGVDIAKTNFVADLSGTSASFAQTEQGHASFIKRVPADACVVCEATGGYEASLVEALWAAKIPVAIVMPKRVRFYAKSLGLLAKTDPIDARLLSGYARACADTLRLYQPLSQAADQLRELLRARDELIEQIKIEANHAEHPSKHPLLAKQPPNATTCSTNNSNKSRRRSKRLLQPIHRCTNAANGSNKSKASARYPLGLYWLKCQNSAPSKKASHPVFLEWLPFVRTPAPHPHKDTSVVDDHALAASSTWPPSAPLNTTPSSNPFTNAYAPKANHLKSLWSLSCANSSNSLTSH
ncbi:hypothetical protein Ga0100231_012760 [Opitutaceae bacterium TAV4]|nr:hypothetical protein Ga0100231_012760 [Opitutaceae bacterium TAV4]